MVNAKSRPETRLDRLIISWQGWQVDDRTFEVEGLEKVDVHEVRQLLDEDVASDAN
jgi:hypothetical protein